MPFAFYQRLSPREKEVYRLSDRISAILLERPDELTPHVWAVREALASGRQGRVQEASATFCQALTDQLLLPRVVVEVLASRPHNENGELHGFYEWEEGTPPLIRVWMRTAKQRRVVAYRTYLRTMLHEVCHHVDFSLLKLPQSFHTAGFFKRESSLYRQVVRLLAK